MPHTGKSSHGGAGGYGVEMGRGGTGEGLEREDERYLDEYGGDLSRTTLRARWIDSPEDHEEHPGQSLATRHHEVIKTWAEERGGHPATVPGTEHQGRPGVLRFDFPGYGGRALEIISWDEWFKSFDERDLVFVFQEQKANGRQSNFFMLDNPEREHD